MEPFLQKQLTIAMIKRYKKRVNFADFNSIFLHILVYLGQMLVGFGLGWTAPIIPKLKDPEQSPVGAPITEEQASWITSVLYIGTITGPYVSGYLSNVKGRKIGLLLGGVLTSLAFLFLAVAQNIAMVFAGRILTGLGTSMIFVINLVYIGEIATTNIRGKLLTGTGIFATLGTLVVYSVGPYVPYSATSYVGLAITFVYIGGLLFIPESPVFYVLKGQYDNAKETLQSLGRQEDIDKILLMKQDPKETGQWKDLTTLKCNRRALVITLTLGILQQMSGIVAVVFFATTIFEIAESSIEPNVATIVIGVTQLASSSIAPFFVERNGRKVLLLASTALCCVSLATLGVYFFLDHVNHPVVENIQWLPLVLLIIFFLAYDMGFGIIPGTFIGELFQSNVRSSGSAVTITTAWLFGFGVSTALGYMISGLGGHVTFWIFSAACALAFLFTIFFVPETKGKSLIEIKEMLSK